MTRVRLEYLDQNESFAPCLPRDGTVLERLEKSDWYLVELDQPIEYSLKEADADTAKQVETNRLLIRSRWTFREIGAMDPTSVFIVLLENDQLPPATPPKIKSYHHVAWGMCHTLG